MRIPSIAMALVSSTMLGFFLWASGCSNLSDDCELNLNCPPLSVDKPNCSKVIFQGTCDVCLQTSCCAEMAECLNDGDCPGYCLNNVLPSPDLCTVVDGALKDKFSAVTQCIKSKCGTDCPPPDTCNPVTHEGCSTVGSSCDLAYPGYFQCYQPQGTPANLCEPCDFHDLPFCNSGLRCHPVSKTCARYCCSDADCGTGRCETNQMLAFGAEIGRPGNNVGICVNKDPMIQQPVCDAPMMAPSGGSCFAGFP